jgi:hypothetical protein
MLVCIDEIPIDSKMNPSFKEEFMDQWTNLIVQVYERILEKSTSRSIAKKIMRLVR